MPSLLKSSARSAAPNSSPSWPVLPKSLGVILSQDTSWVCQFDGLLVAVIVRSPYVPLYRYTAPTALAPECALGAAIATST